MLALGSIRRSGAGPSTACGREVAELFGVPMVSPHTSPHRPQTPHHTLPGSLWFCAPGTVNIHGGVEEQGSKSEAQHSRDLTGNKVGLCNGDQPVANFSRCSEKAGRTSWKNRKLGGCCSPWGSVLGAMALSTAVSVGRPCWGSSVGPGARAGASCHQCEALRDGRAVSRVGDR